jgi:hypothetical protein
VKFGDGGYTPPSSALIPTGLGRLRKIALVGSAETVAHAPFHDPSWEIWTHAITQGKCPRMDRVFEMHPEHVWREHVKPQWPSYLKWLQRCPHPVFMLEKHPDIPSSVRYPRERIFGECRSMIGRLHFGSQADYMIALALSEGVTHLGLFGVQYTAQVGDGVVRDEQLLAFKFWLGVAVGRGVQLVMPEGHPTFDIPAEVYGLESHSTKAKYAARLLATQVTPKGTGTERLVPAATVPLKPLPKEYQDVGARERWLAMA